MLLSKFLSISAALAMTAGSFVVTAAPAFGQSRQVVVTAPREEALPTRRVTYADLDLITTGDQKRLVYRVRAAVRDVCQESVGLMPPKFLDQQCRAFAWDGAQPQIDRAIQRAREIASTDTSSIGSGSISISLVK